MGLGVVSVLGWQSPSALVRVRLNAQEGRGSACSAEIRRMLIARDATVRLLEVEQAPDLLLIAGSGRWAEEFTSRCRASGDPTPLIALNFTPKDGSNSRILDAGADDCALYPIEPSELRARVQAVMRRVGNAWLRCPELAIDRDSLRVRVRAVEARVSRKQFEIFVCLAEHRERWVHSDEIIATVSGTHHDPASSLVRVQICALRKALGEARSCIRSDGNRRYMLTLADPLAKSGTFRIAATERR